MRLSFIILYEHRVEHICVLIWFPQAENNLWIWTELVCVCFGCLIAMTTKEEGRGVAEPSQSVFQPEDLPANLWDFKVFSLEKADGGWILKKKVDVKMEFPCMLRLSQEGLMAGSGTYYISATHWSHVARPHINHSSKVTWTSWWLKCCCLYSPNIDISPRFSLNHEVRIINGLIIPAESEIKGISFYCLYLADGGLILHHWSSDENLLQMQTPNPDQILLTLMWQVKEFSLIIQRQKNKAAWAYKASV